MSTPPDEPAKNLPPAESTPPLVLQIPASDDLNGGATTPESIPERKESTPVHNSNDAHQATAGRHLGNFSTTLTTQTRRVDDVITEIIQRVEKETLLAEVQTLATITGESAKQATRLVEGQPTLPTKNEQGNAPEREIKATTTVDRLGHPLEVRIRTETTPL